jgi:DNA-binding beta-propeller fold protein YncE
VASEAGRACPYAAVGAIGRPGEGVFRQPEAIAVAASGRVYVADQFSHLVQMFSSSGAYEGQWGAAGSGPGEFGAVGGMAIDAHGNVYLVDCAGDRIERFTADGRFIASWGSPGTAVGQLNLGAGNGPSEPPGGGIAVGGGYVYVADTDNNRIERFKTSGADPEVVVGAGSAPGQVRRPHGLALGTGTDPVLYVADNGNDRVQELTTGGRFLAQVSAFAATPKTFQNPYGVAVHGGYVYVADDNHGRVVKLTADLGFVGTFTGEGTGRLTAFIRAVATDAAGRVYVADASGDDVAVFSPAGVFLHRWGVSGIAPGQFVAPVDVASGPHGSLLVAEAYREVVPLRRTGSSLSYSADIVYDSPWSSGGGVSLGASFFSPTGLAYAPDGSVWVSDRNNNLLRHLSSGGHLLEAVGEAAASGGGARPVTPLPLSEPHGVAVNGAGDVVVADTGANRVEELAPNGRLLASWQQAGYRPTRDARSRALGPGAGVGPAARGGAGLNLGADVGPVAVASGPGGTVYVTDSQAHDVVALDSRGHSIAVLGSRGSAPGHFEDPDGLAVGPEGNVFVADGILARIQEFGPSGRLLAAWGAPGTGLGEFDEPTGMTIDCSGSLAVADTANNRVQIFTSVAAPCRS